MVKPLPNLTKQHTRELMVASAISPDVIAERRYQSIDWTLNDKRGQRSFRKLGIPRGRVRVSAAAAC